jgi:hypothetical protein
VLRWVGVAAPAQRHFQGLCLVWPAAQCGTGCDPGKWRFVLPCGAGNRPLTHNGGGRDTRAAMAWPPFQSPARAKPEASDLGSVTFGSPLDPVVGGSLEDAFCVLILWCIWLMQLASAKIKCHTHVPSAVRKPGLLPGFSRHARREICLADAEGSDVQWRKCAAPPRRFVGVSSAPCSGPADRS